MRCSCCDMPLLVSGACLWCDVRMSSPPHVCLRWLTVIGDEHGCPPSFPRLDNDHETRWRLDGIDGPAHEGADP